MFATMAFLLAQTPSTTAPAKLTDENYSSVRNFAKPKASDLTFQQIDWKPSVYEGLLAAQKEDKPMVLWLYFGDPRSSC